ncbi:MAG: hypothetical protein Q9170_002155 [Blastenia crenularia]
MSTVTTLKLAHLPDNLFAYITLYDDVENAAFLQQQLLEGNIDFEYAFIDASVIISSTHLLAAVFRAANDWTNGRLKTKNVHSEIVFCLTMNNNIAESFRRFGISPSTTALYAIKLSTTPSINAATVELHLSKLIQGNPLPFEDARIAEYTDIAKVRKIYKLTDLGRNNLKSTGKGIKGKIDQSEDARIANGGRMKEEAERKELEVMVLGLMALRGAT